MRALLPVEPSSAQVCCQLPLGLPEPGEQPGSCPAPHSVASSGTLPSNTARRLLQHVLPVSGAQHPPEARPLQPCPTGTWGSFRLLPWQALGPETSPDNACGCGHVCTHMPAGSPLSSGLAQGLLQPRPVRNSTCRWAGVGARQGTNSAACPFRKTASRAELAAGGQPWLLSKEQLRCFPRASESQLRGPFPLQRGPCCPQPQRPGVWPRRHPEAGLRTSQGGRLQAKPAGHWLHTAPPKENKRQGPRATGREVPRPQGLLPA